MDFSRIINKSFEVAWRYKSLWVLGLFAGGGSMAFNWPSDLQKKFDVKYSGWDLSNLSFPTEALIPILVWLAMLGFILLLMHFICVPALIDGVNKITRGGSYRLGNSLSAGLHFFFRFLGLGLLFFFVMAAGAVVSVLIVVLCYKVHWALFVISLLVFVPVGLGAVVSGNNIYSLAQRSMVARDVSIGDSIEEGYQLFRHNLGKNIIIFLIEVGLSIGLAILMLLLWGIFGIPIAAIVVASGLGWVAALLLAFLMGLPVSLVAGGFVGTVLTNLYTLFYFELLEPPAAAPAVNPPAAEAAAP